MQYYSDMQKMGFFTMGELVQLTGRPRTARGLLKHGLRQGYVRKIERNLYLANPMDASDEMGAYTAAEKFAFHRASFKAVTSANQIYGLTSPMGYSITPN